MEAAIRQALQNGRQQERTVIVALDPIQSEYIVARPYALFTSKSALKKRSLLPPQHNVAMSYTPFTHKSAGL